MTNPMINKYTKRHLLHDRLLAPYLIVLSIFFVGPLDFSALYAKAALWLLIILMLLKLFISFGKAAALRGPVPDLENDEVIIGYYKYFALPIFAGAAYYVSWLYGQGTNVELVLTKTGEVREITAGTDITKQVAAVVAYQAYGYIPILLTDWRNRFPLYVNAIMAAAIVLMALAVVLQAGRTFFLVAGAIGCATFMVSSKVSKKKEATKRRSWLSSILLYLGIGVATILAGLAIYLIAVQRVTSTEIAITLSNTDYRYLGESIKKLSPSAAYFFTVLFHYLVGPWSNFNIAITVDTDVFRWSMGPLEAIAARFSSDYDAFFSESRAVNYSRYLMLDGQETGWRTGFGNVLDWYGFFGLVVYTCFIGYVAGRLMVKARLSQSLIALLKAVWAITFLFMCLFYFPTDSIFWVNLALTFIIMPLLAKVLGSRRRRHFR